MTIRTAHRPAPLAAGTPAPDFALRTTPEQVVKRSDFLGRPLIVAFYPAGADHQDYYNRHSKTGYCRVVIGRKLDKLKAVFGDRLTE